MSGRAAKSAAAWAKSRRSAVSEVKAKARGEKTAFSANGL
ncbi:hypothetical protein GCWU000246_00456 [Jonquetella anthropi E3_33 E1]|nr:hypothetical protein GCWU000246_00456 [Jonquetella anthropi E3_33 E1]